MRSRRKASGVKRKAAIPYPQGYTLQEFIANPNLLGETQGFFATALGGHILAVLHNSAPSGYPMRGEKVTGEAALMELGRKEGYQDCLNIIYAMCKAVPAPVEIEQDYGASEMED